MGESMEHSDYITLIEQQRENWRTLALTGANEINKMRQQLTIKENDVNSLKGAIQACDHIISIINENIEIVEMEEGTEPESETDEDDIPAIIANGRSEFGKNLLDEIVKLRNAGRNQMKSEIESEIQKMKWNPSDNLFGDEPDPMLGEN
jgi:hypothetical protein